jgi:hypothetical protein
LIAAGLVCVVLGVAVAQIAMSFPRQRTRNLVFAGLFALLFVPQLPPLAQLVIDREIPNWQLIIRHWADTNITPGTVIVYREHERTFNPFWGGIPHRYWFDWWLTKDILEYPLDEWREDRGMSYAIIPVLYWEKLRASEEGQAFLGKLLRLRDFVHPPTRREAGGIFYRLWRMDHELDVHFGDQIILTGYDQNPESDLEPGDTIEFTLYWNAPTTPNDNYQLFMHLVPVDEYRVLAQYDRSPTVPERLTLTWDEPSETLISPPFPLAIPADLSPGDYRVMIGLYNFETGARLSVGAGDAYELARISIR